MSINTVKALAAAIGLAASMAAVTAWSADSPYAQATAESMAFNDQQTYARSASSERKRQQVEPDEGVPAATGHSQQRGSGAIIRVGNTLDCDYSDLQIAISEADDGDTIQLQNITALYRGNPYVIINQSLTIRGGFDSCSDDTPSGRTTLDLDGQAIEDLDRLLTIIQSGTSGPHEVHLENLVLTNAQSASAGGGVLIFGAPGALFVTMANVAVRNNSALNGGGITVFIPQPREGSGPILVMDSDSSIEQNTAAEFGGGLLCFNLEDNPIGTSSLVVLDRTNIIANEARNGGGLAAVDCEIIRYYGGGTLGFIFPTAAIGLNTATESGGGLYLERSQVNVLGTSESVAGISAGDDNAARVLLNQAANGGGAYVTGSGSRLRLSEGMLDTNQADLDGGGVYVNDGGLVLVERSISGAGLAPCAPQQTSDGMVTVPRCSRFRNNSAGRDGGAAFVDGGTLDVRRTIISGNEADNNGSVVTVRGNSEAETGMAQFDDSLVHGNAGSRIFYAWTHSDILVRWSTITDNNSPPNLFRAFTNSGAARIRIAGSIIWEDGGNVLTTGGNGDLTAFGECIIGHQNLSQIDANFQIYSTNNPMLIEKDETRPYFPGPVSPAIDFCHGNFATGSRDLAGSDRGTPHQGSPTLPGPSHGDYDIGAYETDWDVLTDELFDDRFEG